jgi:2-keto-3-deoxy-L-rhamnonate aldolase RhmA
VDEILAVPGLDMVMTGPGDLSQAYGIPGALDDPRILAAEHRVFQAADRARKPVLHFAFSGAELAAIERDYAIDYLVIASDTGLFIGALKQRLSDFDRR